MNTVFRAKTVASRIISISRFRPSNLPAIHLRASSTMLHNVPKLNDPSLLKTNVAYVDGEWVTAKSGNTFEVFGRLILNF
jgi:succinate-semialdehyde dehydrogenase/glutarate-semialdehyde dehydrogenase